MRSGICVRSRDGDGSIIESDYSWLNCAEQTILLFCVTVRSSDKGRRQRSWSGAGLSLILIPDYYLRSRILRWHRLQGPAVRAELTNNVEQAHRIRGLSLMLAPMIKSNVIGKFTDWGITIWGCVSVPCDQARLLSVQSQSRLTQIILGTNI